MCVQGIRTNDKHAHILVDEKNHKFSETQYGFRRNKGYTDNLAILTTQIIKEFEERNSVSALFLDIKSAYDNVHCGTLIDSWLLRKSVCLHL
jgi:hypothetical protein